MWIGHGCDWDLSANSDVVVKQCFPSSGARSDWSMEVEPQAYSLSSPIQTRTRTVTGPGKVVSETATIPPVIRH